VSGTAASQGVIFLLQIPIARVYSDVDKGLFGVYGSITGFVITFAALRFEPGDEVVNVGGEVHGVFRVWLEGLVVFVCEAGGVQLYIHLSARSVCKWVGGLSHVY